MLGMVCHGVFGVWCNARSQEDLAGHIREQGKQTYEDQRSKPVAVATGHLTHPRDVLMPYLKQQPLEDKILEAICGGEKNRHEDDYYPGEKSGRDFR